MDLMRILLEFTLDWIMELLENVLGSNMFSSLYYTVFLPENQLPALNVNGIYNTIYGCASILLVIAFIKKMIECYFSWQSGDPDTNPLVIVVNFMKALIAMLIFGEIYKLVIPAGYTFYQTVVGTVMDQQQAFNELKTVASGGGLGAALIAAIIVIVCCWVGLFFQMMMRGVETLILRLIVPFTCIGLINSDGGSFNVMVKRFIQNVSTVILQLVLLNATFIIVASGHFFWGISFAMVTLRTPAFLSEFLLVRQGTPVSQRVGQAANGIAGAYKFFKK